MESLITKFTYHVVIPNLVERVKIIGKNLKECLSMDFKVSRIIENPDKNNIFIIETLQLKIFIHTSSTP